MSVYELAESQSICPYHYEYPEEEWLIVLEGRPTLRHPDGETVLAPGDTVCFPSGPDGRSQGHQPELRPRPRRNALDEGQDRRRGLSGQRQGGRLVGRRRRRDARPPLGRRRLLPRRALTGPSPGAATVQTGHVQGTVPGRVRSGHVQGTVPGRVPSGHVPGTVPGTWLKKPMRKSPGLGSFAVDAAAAAIDASPGRCLPCDRPRCRSLRDLRR